MGCSFFRSIKTLEDETDEIRLKSKITSPTGNKNSEEKEEPINSGDISILSGQKQDQDVEIFKKVKEIGKRNNNCKSFLIRSTETMMELAYKLINVSGSDEEFMNKVLNDINTLKTLNHPNIITFRDAHFSKDRKYFFAFTEYANNGDLQIQLDEHKTKGEYFDEETLLNWLMQISFALQYIHSKGILHRNIKPSNIFLMQQNFVKLGDFGVAKTLNSKLKYAKTIVSQPEYLAPETFKKEGYSYKLDIWSLGVTFYQLMYFSFPFEGDNDDQIQNNILNGKRSKPLYNNNYSKKFEELINEMLSVWPDERPTAEEILEKNIIKSRIECYLEENGFDTLKSQNTIKDYEKEIEIENIKQSRRSKKEREIFVVDGDYDIDDPEKYKESEAKKAKKIIYDFHRQMTLLKKQIINKSKTYKKWKN